MKGKLDDPQAFADRVRPLFAEMYRTAHVIVGNGELAEYVMQNAMYEAYVRRGEWFGRMPFAEGISRTLLTVALTELGNLRNAGKFETDWSPRVPQEAGDARQKLVASRLARENDETLRTLVLYYGCGLKRAHIAKVMQRPARDVKASVRKVRARLSRGIAGRKETEARLEALSILMLTDDTGELPDEGLMFRTFERDVEGQETRGPSVRRIALTVLKCVGAVVLAVAIWLVCVLTAPETGGTVPSTTAAQQEETAQ